MSDESTGKRHCRVINALAGGWVADAAALGLHWLYDSQRILEVGGDAPEFLTPDAEHYLGGVGYLAHEGKRAGDMSHYGAATEVLTKSLLANQGRLNIIDYQRRFRLFFGPGGAWQGYLDNPTRVTLENLTAIENGAIQQGIDALANRLTDEQTRILVQKVLPYTRYLSGDALDAPIRRAISATYPESDVQDAGIHLARTIDQHRSAKSGAVDMQLPAISKLPPLVASYCGSDRLMEVTEAAVRVTNNHNEAVAWARCAAKLLDQLFQGHTMQDALQAAIEESPNPDTLNAARLGTRLDGPGAGDQFGRTCYLNEAMPVCFHILQQADSFTEAIRANIQCGGDSCGRAWLIGPAMAALHGAGTESGCPLSWLARVSNAPDILGDIEALVQQRQE
ncbi:MAG: ADP-ribosylglycohydrolase family protein [Gammaproteobacteria bacterium]|nr:MAG: ADP-ribosylglycohydrolase family protein [Gammaproteobacteria bacterium]